MECPNCDSPYPADANFCSNCGFPLAVECGLCTARNEVSSRICQSCGQGLAARVRSSFLGATTASPASFNPAKIENASYSGRASDCELRKVTVIFCDIVASTRRAAEIGPEAMHLLLNDFFRLSLDEVNRYEGVINNYLGDGFMALFGAPRAHEYHARQAVLAAIYLQRRLAEAGLGRGQSLGPLVARIGINTGPVVVGRVSDDSYGSYTADGETTHVAFRLQQSAEPGGILVSGATRSQAQGYIAFKEGPVLRLSHSDKPLPTFGVVGVGERRARIDAIYYPPQSMFVGREAELEALVSAFARTERGDGGIVEICAGAGVGKSRLLLEARRRFSAARFRYVEARCATHGRNIPFYLVQDLVRELCEVSASDPKPEAQAKILAAANRDGREDDAYAALLLQVLNRGPAQAGPSPPPAVGLAQAIYEAVCDLLVAQTSGTPLVVVVEDAHWIDAPSRDFLGFLGSRMAGLPLLLIVTHRDDDGLDLPLSDTIQLGPLSAENAAKIMEVGIRLAALPSSTKKLVLQKAGGNPLFLEELINAFRERAAQKGNEAVPDTINDILMSRVDALPLEAKRVLQTASVLGFSLNAELLADLVGDEDKPRLAELLEILTKAEFLTADARSAGAFRFRHALIQDVAYESLLVSRRERLHERAGHAMVRAHEAVTAVGRGAFDVDLIAYHFSRSANREKELAYAEKGAETAVRKGAYAEAYRYVSRALELIEALPAPERAAREIGLRLAEGPILLTLRGQGSAEARATYERALELCSSLGPGPEVGRALFGIWTYFLFHGLMREADAAVLHIMQLAERTEDPDVQIMAQLAAAQTFMWLGDWPRCLSHARAVDALYMPGRHSLYVARYAQNPRVTALFCHIYAHWALGTPETAQALLTERIEEARGLDHEFTFVMASICRTQLAHIRRRHDELAATVDELVDLAERAGGPFYFALAKVYQAAAFARSGRAEESVQQAQAMRRGMQDAGALLIDPLVAAMLAECQQATGRIDEALATVESSLADFSARGQDAFIPELHRMRGDLLRAGGVADEQAIEACYREAMRLASRQSAKSMELRAALGLFQLWADHGRVEEARDLLRALRAACSEGWDDPDLVEADRLLDIRQKDDLGAEGKDDDFKHELERTRAPT